MHSRLIHSRRQASRQYSRSPARWREIQVTHKHGMQAHWTPPRAGLGPVRNPVLRHRVASCFPWFLSFGIETKTPGWLVQDPTTSRGAAQEPSSRQRDGLAQHALFIIRHVSPQTSGLRGDACVPRVRTEKCLHTEQCHLRPLARRPGREHPRVTNCRIRWSRSSVK